MWRDPEIENEPLEPSSADVSRSAPAELDVTMAPNVGPSIYEVSEVGNSAIDGRQCRDTGYMSYNGTLHKMLPTPADIRRLTPDTAEVNFRGVVAGGLTTSADGRCPSRATLEVEPRAQSTGDHESTEVKGSRSGIRHITFRRRDRKYRNSTSRSTSRSSSPCVRDSPGRPHFPADRPLYQADQSRSSGDRPLSTGDRPQWTADRPVYQVDQSRSSGDRPLSTDDRPHSTVDQPHCCGDRPQWTADRPLYQVDRSHVSSERPHFPADRPLSQVNRPRSYGDRPLSVGWEPERSARLYQPKHSSLGAVVTDRGGPDKRQPLSSSGSSSSSEGCDCRRHGRHPEERKSHQHRSSSARKCTLPDVDRRRCREADQPFINSGRSFRRFGVSDVKVDRISRQKVRQSVLPTLKLGTI